MLLKKYSIPEANPILVDLGIHITPDQWHYDYYKVDQTYREFQSSKNDGLFNSFCREMSRKDFYFFCRWILGYNMIDHPFMIARCYDIQDQNNYTLDLWPRGHLKSSLITQALSIWDILHNPDLTIGIFSVTGGDARKHLKGIKSILENNKLLRNIWPDVIYDNPERDSDKWSLLEGLTVKRNSNVKECSISGYSLIDKMPTGSHWDVLVFDDLINEQTVNNPEMIRKAADAFRSADNLGKYKEIGGVFIDSTIKRVIGTRYNVGDVYGDLIKEGGWNVRMFPAECDETGTFVRHSTPIFLTAEELDKKFRKQGEFIYNSQMGQNPIAKSKKGFRREWLQHYKPNELPHVNKYLLVDPAHKKGKQHDYTVMLVIGLSAERKYYVIDMLRDRLSLGEKWEKIKYFVKKYEIRNAVGYETIGSYSDVEYYQMEMPRDRMYIDFALLGGNEKKENRIERLVPLFQHGRFLLPHVLTYTDVDGHTHELVHEFVEEEYLTFPYGKHDDLMDTMARILDKEMETNFPIEYKKQMRESHGADPLSMWTNDKVDWMIA